MKTQQKQKQLQQISSQTNEHIKSSQIKQQKLHYLTILKNILNQNTNHKQIKQQLYKKTSRIQILLYTSLVDNQAKYVQKIGKLDHQQNIFNYIGKLLNQKENIYFNQYQNGQNIIKIKTKHIPQPQPQPSKQIMYQVQYVLQNVDLPLSLFKRNDNYWSIDNPKTLQAKDYLKKIHQQDQKFKNIMKKKKNQIWKQKQDIRNKTIDVIKRQQQNQKKQLQSKINKKLEQLKRNSKQRQKSISQSVQFMKQRGRPLFKKIQKDFKQKIQIPQIQQTKKKLSQIRQVMRSVPLDQIQSHRQKYQKLKSQHQHRSIVNQPLNISFKSHFYEEIKGMSASKFDQSNLSLYQKRLQYSRMVKQTHKPAVDSTKKDQLQSRIKLMNKRRARAKKNKKQTKNSDQDSDAQPEEPQQQQEQQQPQPQQNSDDDSDKPRPQRDDQYQPTQQERYKMGLNYLKAAKKLAVKRQSQSQEQKSQNFNPKKSPSVLNQGQSKQKHQEQTILQQSENNKKQKFIWISKYDEQPKKQQRIKYKNYLRQIQARKDNQQNPNNILNTDLIKKQIQKGYGTTSRLSANKAYNRQRISSRNQSSRKPPDLQYQMLYQTNLENKIRNIEQKAKHQEQLLRYKRINRQQKISKKMAIDDAVVDTIKARLLMMNNKTLES